MRGKVWSSNLQNLVVNPTINSYSYRGGASKFATGADSSDKGAKTR